jgi:hypothetical protein
MPAKHKFQAYPGEVTWQKLEEIRKYEADKAGVKINDSWLLQNFVEVRHESLTAGRSNRERIADIVAAVTTMDEKIDRLITFLMEEKSNVRPDDN